MTPEQIATIDAIISQPAMDAFPFPVQLFRSDGLVMRVNRANQEFWRVPPEAVVGTFNMLEHPGPDPRVIPAFKEALTGRPVILDPVVVDVEALGLGDLSKKVAWIENVFCPMRGPTGEVQYVLLLQRDVTPLVERQEEIERAHREIASQRKLIESLEEARRELAAQRVTIQALSSPIIEVWRGVLTLPCVGHIDAERAADMTERLLAAVVAARARFVILDLTGINGLDAAAASHLKRIFRAIELLGARGLVAGVKPAVAQTVTSLELTLDRMSMHRNLRDALTYCMRSAGGAER